MNDLKAGGTNWWLQVKSGPQMCGVIFVGLAWVQKYFFI